MRQHKEEAVKALPNLMDVLDSSAAGKPVTATPQQQQGQTTVATVPPAVKHAPPRRSQSQRVNATSSAAAAQLAQSPAAGAASSTAAAAPGALPQRAASFKGLASSPSPWSLLSAAVAAGAYSGLQAAHSPTAFAQLAAPAALVSPRCLHPAPQQHQQPISTSSTSALAGMEAAVSGMAARLQQGSTSPASRSPVPSISMLTAQQPTLQIPSASPSPASATPTALEAAAGGLRQSLLLQQAMDQLQALLLLKARRASATTVSEPAQPALVADASAAALLQQAMALRSAGAAPGAVGLLAAAAGSAAAASAPAAAAAPGQQLVSMAWAQRQVAPPPVLHVIQQMHVQEVRWHDHGGDQDDKQALQQAQHSMKAIKLQGQQQGQPSLQPTAGSVSGPSQLRQTNSQVMPSAAGTLVKGTATAAEEGAGSRRGLLTRSNSALSAGSRRSSSGSLLKRSTSFVLATSKLLGTIKSSSKRNITKLFKDM
jgi:hypothetical protein